MNATKLVEMVKAIGKGRLNQSPLSHHSARYAKTLTQKNRYKPEGRNLAEVDEKKMTGKKTDTGKTPDLPVFDPVRPSLAASVQGSKPQLLDTK